MSREARLAQKILKRDQRPELKTEIASGMYIPNHSGDHSKGKVFKTPVDDYDIANKKYVDDNAGGGGGSLRVESAGSLVDATVDTLDFSNEFTLSESPEDDIDISLNLSNVDHDSLQNFVANEHIDWTTDQGATNIDNNNITALPVANTALVAGTNITLSTNTLNVDDAFIKNDADDTSTGKITAANFAVTGDNNTNDTEYVPMVLHGTDATPPTASTVPRGTIYIQYTA